MFIDLNEVDGAAVDKLYDICICGAGVAGITLALELAERFRVILLEGGGMQVSAESQRLYQGEIAGRDYFDLAATRLRCLGGSSNHWAGWCRPLDAHDFESKPHHEFSGWPIGHEDLKPHLERACDILDIPWPAEADTTHPDAIRSQIDRSDDLQAIDFWWSAPTRVGAKYEQTIRSNPNLTCLLHANLTDIRLRGDGLAVESFEVRDYSGKPVSIRADRFILATGGIENPRVLLNCNSQLPDGIGNSEGLVGRFFTEHPHHLVGNFILEDHIREQLAESWVDYWSSLRFFSPTPAFMTRERILNFGLRFIPSQTSLTGGVRGALKDLVCRAAVLESTAEWVSGEDVNCFDGAIRIAFEQALNIDSRVRLSGKTDRFGRRRALLDWQLGPLDRRTIRAAALRFGEVFALSGLGRLKVEDWILSDEAEFPGIGEDETAGHHHMCTTRMGTTPQDGVVDSTQKVFGLDNFYIAGSSVFSTAGHANPTFTIVQMSLRLAKHLKR